MRSLIPHRGRHREGKIQDPILSGVGVGGGGGGGGGAGKRHRAAAIATWQEFFHGDALCSEQIGLGRRRVGRLDSSHRHTHTHTHKNTHRHTHKHTHHTDTHTDTHRHVQTQSHRKNHTHRHTDRTTDTHAHTHTNITLHITTLVQCCLFTMAVCLCVSVLPFRSSPVCSLCTVSPQLIMSCTAAHH